MFLHGETSLEFGCNSLFCTNIDNGLWDIATVTVQSCNGGTLNDAHNSVFSFNFAPRCLVLRQVLSR